MEVKVMADTTAKQSNSTMWVIIAVIVIALGGFIFYQHWTLTQKNSQITTLTDEKTALETEKQTLTTSVAEITATIDEVSAKLQDIRKKQVVIKDLVAKSGEMGKKEQLLDDITAIETQLASDRRDIDDLTKKMQQSGVRIKSLENMVANLRKEIDKNTQEIAQLKSTIVEKDKQIATTENNLRQTQSTLTETRTQLTSTSQKLDTTQNTLTKTLNTAWYIIGTKDELIEKNIIDQQGRFYQRKSLNLDGNINEGNFTAVDITRQSEFQLQVGAKNVKLVPERSAECYQITEVAKNQSVLKVVDPATFWKIKYVAFVVKG
jgi:predicted  nucleic acid-binding Zn-ribbon protein